MGSNVMFCYTTPVIVFIDFSSLTSKEISPRDLSEYVINFQYAYMSKHIFGLGSGQVVKVPVCIADFLAKVVKICNQEGISLIEYKEAFGVLKNEIKKLYDSDQEIQYVEWNRSS